MLIIFIINMYLNINRFFNCIIQICMFIIVVIHIIHQVVTKFLLRMKLMGHGGLFMVKIILKIFT